MRTCLMRPTTRSPGRANITPIRCAWLVCREWAKSGKNSPGEQQARPCAQRAVSEGRLTETMVEWCREQGFRWIYLHACEQGRPLYESVGFEPSSEMRLKL